MTFIGIMLVLIWLTLIMIAEAIEEDKKIEKLDLQYKDITKGINFEEQILSYCDNLQYKINEIIDYINKEEK